MKYFKISAGGAVLLSELLSVTSSADAGGIREFSGDCHIDKTRAAHASAWKKFSAKNQNDVFYFIDTASYGVSVKLPGVERVIDYKVSKKLLRKEGGGKFELLPDNPNIRQSVLPVEGMDLQKLVWRIKESTKHRGVYKGELISTFDGEIEAYYADETVHSNCLIIFKY